MKYEISDLDQDAGKRERLVFVSYSAMVHSGCSKFCENLLNALSVSRDSRGWGRFFFGAFYFTRFWHFEFTALTFTFIAMGSKRRQTCPFSYVAA